MAGRRGLCSVLQWMRPRTTQKKVPLSSWTCHVPFLVYTTSSSTKADLIHGEVCVTYAQGLPVIVVPLPSRREKCQFTLKPVSSTVGDFLSDLRLEDRGIDLLTVQTTDGIRIASSTSIEMLMQEDFILVVNDRIYSVSPPDFKKLTSEELQSLSDVKSQVARLYEILQVDRYQLDVEQKLLGQLEQLKQELEPLEKKKEELAAVARRRNTIISWVGLSLMGVQFGVVARLTWWEYSWDIMEPVTYFITYGTTMAMYAYFVLTRQEYTFSGVSDREFLSVFHKEAKKQGLDVEQYNHLRDAVAQVEEDLRRLRDPLQLHLPIKELTRSQQEDTVR